MAEDAAVLDEKRIEFQHATNASCRRLSQVLRSRPKASSRTPLDMFAARCMRTARNEGIKTQARDLVTQAARRARSRTYTTDERSAAVTSHLAERDAQCL